MTHGELTAPNGVYTPMLRVLSALAACVFTLDAEPILTHRPLDSLAEADALIVGRVTSVEKRAEVFPPNDRTWQHRVFEHLAEVEILRFHASARELRERLETQGRVRVGYRAENPLDQGGVFGGPLWPAIRVGEVRVFGVRNGPDRFRLWFEEGLGAVPPAQERLLRELPAPDGVAFLERELVNGLALGDGAMAFNAARSSSPPAMTPRIGDPRSSRGSPMCSQAISPAHEQRPRRFWPRRALRARASPTCARGARPMG